MLARHSSAGRRYCLRAPTPWAAAAALILLAGGCSRSAQQAASAAPPDRPAVRPPAVAGQFYPGDAGALARAVDGYLAAAKASASTRAITALIVPHAGYDFCGKVAGHAYAALKGRSVATVVVVGPSHRASFGGAALCSAKAWETPLGTIPADRALVAALAGREGFALIDDAHASEHCIEVQLPFLQRTLGKFQLVAVLMSDFSRANCARVAQALAAQLKGRNALLIASSDMSHYPAYEDACDVDAQTLDAISSFDPARVRARSASLLARGTPGLQCALCGLGPVVAVMEAAKRLDADKVEVLCYANSGDAMPQTKDRVVGYCAAAIYGKEGATMSDKSVEAAPGSGEAELNEAQQRKLLRLARRAIGEYVRSRTVIEVTEDDPMLAQPRGVFVTLRHGQMLRGCIGDLEGREPLYLNVRDRAIASATQDFRFEPVRPAEVPELTIEISALSPMQPVKDPSKLVAGKHGVMVSQGSRAGVYLPQVATEQGWTCEEMLNHLCQYKAGLPADAWRKGADLYCFTAQVFGEDELGR